MARAPGPGTLRHSVSTSSLTAVEVGHVPVPASFFDGLASLGDSASGKRGARRPGGHAVAPSRSILTGILGEWEERDDRPEAAVAKDNDEVAPADASGVAAAAEAASAVAKRAVSAGDDDDDDSTVDAGGGAALDASSVPNAFASASQRLRAGRGGGRLGGRRPRGASIDLSGEAHVESQPPRGWVDEAMGVSMEPGDAEKDSVDTPVATPAASERTDSGDDLMGAAKATVAGAGGGDNATTEGGAADGTGDGADDDGGVELATDDQRVDAEADAAEVVVKGAKGVPSLPALMSRSETSSSVPPLLSPVTAMPVAPSAIKEVGDGGGGDAAVGEGAPPPPGSPLARDGTGGAAGARSEAIAGLGAVVRYSDVNPQSDALLAAAATPARAAPPAMSAAAARKRRLAEDEDDGGDEDGDGDGDGAPAAKRATGDSRAHRAALLRLQLMRTVSAESEGVRSLETPGSHLRESVGWFTEEGGGQPVADPVAVAEAAAQAARWEAEADDD